MIRPDRDRLGGEVEVDGTYVGGVQAGGGRRHLGNKAMLVIGAQGDGQGIGRIRMRRIPDAATNTLISFVKAAVEPGTIVFTDGRGPYEGLEKEGFTHKPRVLSGSGKTASTLLPRMHRVASLLKRWLLGTHQGAVYREQLEYSLDEFAFRFNRRTSRHRGKLFSRLVENAVAIGPAPNADLIVGTDHKI